MRKIGIIGLGHVGRLLAHQLVTTGMADQLVLIDQDDDLALAVQTDLLDAATAISSSTKILIQDYGALHDADILVTAFGDSSLLQEKLMEELLENGATVQKIAPQIKDSGFHGIVLNISDPNEAVTAYLQEQLAVPPKRVLGLGTTLDTAQMRLAVANAAQLSSDSVSGFVYGQHNGQSVIAWSTVTVNGQPLTASINGHHLDTYQLEIAAKQDNWYTLHGLGYNASAAVTWTVKIISAILGDANLAVPLAFFQPQYNTYLSFPVLVNAQGQGNPLLLNLYPVEQEGIKNAANTIFQQLTILREKGLAND